VIIVQTQKSIDRSAPACETNIVSSDARSLSVPRLTSPPGVVVGTSWTRSAPFSLASLPTMPATTLPAMALTMPPGILSGLLSVALLAGAACVTPGDHARHAPPQSGPGPGSVGGQESRQDSALRFIDVGDAWLRVRDVGPVTSTKTPLLLLHGFGSRLETWAAVQDALAVDRRVIAFDHKGFGHSERSAGDYGPEKHARDAVAILDALSVPRAVLAGHSYGGGVALRVALRAPDRVAGLGLVDAFALAEQVPTSFAWAKAPGLGEFIFSTLFTEMPGEKYVLAFHDGQRFATAEVLDDVRALQERPGSTYAELATVRGMDYDAVQGRYAGVTAALPKVVVWGEDDRVTPLAQGERLAALLDAPLVIVPACGHMPTWERPSAVVHALQGVLAAADAAVAPAATRVRGEP
jgi:pimeloyl-ACP methyl ester carboxylesterase